jgi:hypothetical protein
VRARPSSSPCVQALRKRVKSLRSNDIFTSQRFFLLYLLGYQFILSLPVRREDGFGYRSIEERERKKITKILTNGSCLLLLILVVLLHFLSPLRAWFLPHTHSASVIFCMMVVVEAKNDFPTRPSFFFFFSPVCRFVLM